jgi:hypothetical protein
MQPNVMHPSKSYDQEVIATQILCELRLQKRSTVVGKATHSPARQNVVMNSTREQTCLTASNHAVNADICARPTSCSQTQEPRAREDRCGALPWTCCHCMHEHRWILKPMCSQESQSTDISGTHKFSYHHSVTCRSRVLCPPPLSGGLPSGSS